MVSVEQADGDVLLTAIGACVKNGQRLFEESYDLEFREPPSSRYFLVMIAQEEFANAFILFIVREGVTALTPAVLRAINDHACKQLVGVILDYMIMHWEEVPEMRVAVRRDHELGDRLPHEVGSAMELLRYEKIGRWENNRWVCHPHAAPKVRGAAKQGAALPPATPTDTTTTERPPLPAPPSTPR